MSKYEQIKALCQEQGLKVRKNYVASSKYPLKAPTKFSTIKGITVHNTDNDASANNEVAYMRRNGLQTGFHIAVDDKEAVIGIPLDRHCWHAGDNLGDGNMKTIGIEICYSLSGGKRFDKAEKNCAILLRAMLEVYGFNLSNIYQHHDWSGKDCPHRTRARGWKRFLNMIKPSYAFDVEYRVKYGYKKVLGKWKKNGQSAGQKKTKLRSIICKSAQGDLYVRARNAKTKKWTAWTKEGEWLPNAIYDRVQFDLRNSDKDIHYRVYVKNHGWLEWVRNYGKGSDGYAGIDGYAIRKIEVYAE